MKSVFIKTAFIFLVSIAFAQTSSAMGWRHGGYYGRHHCERERGYYHAPVPQPFVQPYYYAPQPYYPPVWERPHFRRGYGYRRGC